MKLHILPLFFLAFCISTHSQVLTQFSYYTINNGLSENNVISLLQDKKGNMWFGTYDGLNKFDGYSFKRYKNDCNNQFSLLNYQISKIKQDKNGFIWIQTNDGHIYRFDPLTEKFLPFPQCSERFKNFNYPLKLSGIFNDGSIWLASSESDNHLFKVQSSDIRNNYQILDLTSKLNRKNSGKINTIRQDKFQNTWILSSNETYLMRTNSQRVQFFRPYTYSTVIHTLCDDSPVLYFGCNNGILSIYNQHNNSIRNIQLPLRSNITNIHKVGSSELFILTDKEGFGLYNLSTNKYSAFNKATDYKLKDHQFASSYMDKRHNIWLEAEDQSIVYFEVSKRKISTFLAHNNSLIQCSSKINFFIIEDKKDNIWVQLKGTGLCLYNRCSNQLEPFYNGPLASERKFPNNVRTGMFDAQGNLWLCPSNFGLVEVVFRQNPFICHKIIDNLNFSDQNQVRAIYQDKDKWLWVATRNGLLYLFDPNRKLLGWMGADGRLNSKQPFSSFIYHIMCDHTGAIWMSSKGQGLFKIQKHSKGLQTNFEIQNYQQNPHDIYSLNSNMVYNSFEDSHHRLWIATFEGGLNLAEEKNGKVYFINYLNRFRNYPIRECFRTKYITEDSHGLIYVGSSKGLVVFNPNTVIPEQIKFHRYIHDSQDKQSLSANDVHCILPAKNGRLYIGTYGGGLNVVQNGITLGQKPIFKSYTRSNGAFSDVVYTLQQDQKGEIWLSTQTKIARFNPKTERFDIYNPVVSVPYNFMEATASQTPQGDLMYGTTEGFIQFNPQNVKKSIYVPRLVLTQLQILNKEMGIGVPGSPLKQIIDNETEIFLNHQQNMISISYAALDFTDPSGIQYAYKLDGIDNDWNYVRDQRTATYTNLPKGTYIFHVKSTNADGQWVNNEKSIILHRSPSFGESIWGILVYCLLVILFILLAAYILFTYYKLKNEVLIEHRVTDLKLRFFADISHELRTPLTLISAPIEHILQHEALSGKTKKQLTIVKHNTDRMLRLINQLLDFRKVQNKKMKLILEEISVSDYTKDIASNFYDLAEEKHIAFSLKDHSNNAHLWVDKDKFEKILFNLISNAFKYTLPGKQIQIEIDETPDTVNLSVSDQGIGITQEMLKVIFNRFESLVNTNHSVSASTGIGLSLTKELVKLHKASIDVVSEPGKGSTFSISFLKGVHHFDNRDEYVLQDLIPQNQPTALQKEISADFIQNNTTRNTILIVEDNEELRSVLTSILQTKHTIVEAGNGKEAISMLSNLSPDLIISDIMMPEMDGLEMTKIIKDDINYSHIPLILLTAKHNIESKLDAMKYCVDDYITKPFSSVYLEARVENILQLRLQLQEYYRDSITNKPPPIAKPEINVKDDSLIKSIIQYIETHLDDSDLSIDRIAIHFGFSRSSLFKKMKSLTGLAPIDLIKELRLQKAANLIETGEYNISQVSYMVGIDDPRYFSRCFKQRFNISPREYRNK